MPIIAVQGMHCQHCREAVTQAIKAVPGVRDVRVDLDKGEAVWQDTDPARPVNPEEIREAVREIGFDAP